MLHIGVESLFSGDCEFVSEFPRIATMLCQTNSLHDTASIPRDLIKLIVTLFDSPCLEAGEKALKAKVDFMVGRIGISEVDLIEVLLFAELVVRDSHVLLTSQLFADIIAHGYIFIIDDVFRAHIAFGANFIFAITLTDFR